MKVMLTVLYLTIGINGLPMSTRTCVQDPRTFTIEEIENIVYALANAKGVSPTVILNRILRRIRFRQKAEKLNPRNPLQELALQELLLTRPRPHHLSSGNDAIQSSISGQQPLPPSVPLPPPPGQGTLMTGMFPPPAAPQAGFAPQLFPPSLYIPVQNLRPPPGITIRVKTGRSDSALPEVMVTLSPMMTIVEALKQAESQFRSVLGLSPVSDGDVISFNFSSYAECYVISNFDNVQTNDRGYWKVVVSDNTGKIIYDSVCLPSRNEMAVKPGMTITLLYAVI